jgi:hypothetical protein
MIGTMQDLRVDAVEKQRELEEQLAAVQARRDAALARLTDEVIPQREARLARQRAALTAALSFALALRGYDPQRGWVRQRG